MSYTLKNQLVHEVPSLSEKLVECEACQFGKQTKKPFLESSWRASQKLQLIHTDPVEPQRITSLNKNIGKEYVANQFQRFCDEAEIEHQLTSPYTPQQNGVDERKNRSIMEMASSKRRHDKATTHYCSTNGVASVPYECQVSHNDFLQEKIFVEQPGFMINGQEDKVYLLKKALYGLKQAPRVWYNKTNDHLLHLGFQKSLSKATLYVKCVGPETDDLLITGSNLALIEKLKQEMKDVFEMTYLGLMTFFGHEDHSKV
ncbi:hypothetical protein CR513_29633, partial [Mucuna pruriens]